MSNLPFALSSNVIFFIAYSMVQTPLSSLSLTSLSLTQSFFFLSSCWLQQHPIFYNSCRSCLYTAYFTIYSLAMLVLEVWCSGNYLQRYLVNICNFLYTNQFCLHIMFYILYIQNYSGRKILLAVSYNHGWYPVIFRFLCIIWCCQKLQHIANCISQIVYTKIACPWGLGHNSSLS